MYCFSRFVNDTTFPSVSVITDDRAVFGDILKGETTPYRALSAGTRMVSVLQNNGKAYINASISLPPYKYCTIVIKNTGICVRED